MKFLVDECLRPLVADLLKEAGHDAIHVGDVGLLGKPNAEVLALAAAHVRVVVSAEPTSASCSRWPGIRRRA